MDITALPVIGLVVSIAVFLISLLVLWFVIYTAVRSALRSHRDAMAEERSMGRYPR